MKRIGRVFAKSVVESLLQGVNYFTYPKSQRSNSGDEVDIYNLNVLWYATFRSARHQFWNFDNW